jgi:hypothetical protein
MLNHYPHHHSFQTQTNLEVKRMFMKITPIAPAGANLGSVQTTNHSPDRMAQAKAIAEGRQALESTDPQVRRMENNVRKIKMRTAVSTDRMPEMPPVESEQSVISEEIEPEVSEETKPLSPQFAALAKQRRALQVKERELQDREQALQQSPGQDASGELAARLKSEPLRVLQEQGVLTPDFYNAFTEFLVSGQSGVNPDVQALKDEIKALREGVDKQLSERDQQAETQVLNELRKEADLLARDGDTFELVRETNSVPKVIELIHRTYKESGEVLDVSDAMQMVEDHLLEENLKIANYKKIQSRFQSTQDPQLQQQRPITLTNRDTAQQPMDRRARALLAATGQLKRN